MGFLSPLSPYLSPHDSHRLVCILGSPVTPHVHLHMVDMCAGSCRIMFDISVAVCHGETTQQRRGSVPRRNVERSEGNVSDEAVFAVICESFVP